MDDNLYDEFGNYLGPEVPEEYGAEDGGAERPDWLHDDEDEGAEAAGEGVEEGDGGAEVDGLGAHARAAAGAGPSSSAIVLHEDKKYYPDADEVYPEAETLVQDEDTQPLSQPIVAPISVKNFSLLEKEVPDTTYKSEFLTALMASPQLIRNVAVIGHLHHGKTTFLDSLIESTHSSPWDPTRTRRYTMARQDEQERGISIKATPVSLVLQDARGKSFLLHLMDTPGHVNFSDEVSASLPASDGCVVVVDAVEGVMLNTQRTIEHALQAGLTLTLVISKVDRLILELKIPPSDAYYKLSQIIAEVNSLINSQSTGAKAHPPLSPVDGNVAFAGSIHSWSFTLDSFARMYVDRHMASSSSGADGSSASSSSSVDPRQLARRLWGDIWYDPSTRRFKNKSPGGGATRSFVHFVLEPLYKVYSHVLGEEPKALGDLLSEIGVKLRKSELSMDAKPLLRLVFRQFLGSADGIVEMLVRHIPSPAAAASAKVDALYLGDLDSPEAEAMRACDPRGPLMFHVVKLFPSPDASHFLAFGRVFSGTLVAGQTVKVLGESYTAEDAEDVALAPVSGLSVGQARYRLEVDRIPAGNWALVEGIDGVINKTATVTSSGPEAADVAVFRPLTFNTIACVNLSVEPLNPSELPKVLAGLRAVQKSYPLARTRVEESGEHVLIGTGELAMDSMMHDLREMYARVEVKVSDPVVSFTETCVEQSSISCFADTPNKKNRLTMVAEPLDKGLAEDIESGAVDIHWDRRKLSDFFQTKYQWDLLAAKSVWSFGPGEKGPNIILDDTLAGEVDKRALLSIKDSVIQAFQWASREGPLCDEPVRNVKFKLTGATIAEEPMFRGGGQVIPTARRAAYSSLLLATPRLMEPMYHVEVLAPADAVQAVYAVLARRRGHVSGDAPKPGTPFYTVKGYLPVIDSFGFETDLRVHTQGMAFGMQVFDHWALVPGDPLDKSIILRPLEPSPPLALAREFMVKTRRRKGLAEDVSVTKYFDEEMLLYMAQQEAEATGGGDATVGSNAAWTGSSSSAAAAGAGPRR